MNGASHETTGVQHASTLLFGSDGREGVVACEVRDAYMGKPPEATLWMRRGDEVASETLNWRPWLAADREPGTRGCRITRLVGEGLNVLCECDSFGGFQEAREALREAGAEPGVHMAAFPSFTRQFLMRSGVTFFKGMSFADIVRMQIDVETVTLSHKSSRARVLMIAIGDSRGFREVLSGDEAEMISRLGSIIRERDPDVIEGHNFFGFDLPYLLARAEAHGLALNWGRDGSAVRPAGSRRFPFGGITRPFSPAYVFGRSLTDTLLGVQRYDVGRSELTTYALKEVAAQLGIAEPDRVYLDRRAMEKLCIEDPQTVSQYAIQDVCETASLSGIVMPPDFYVTQMVPDSYQANVTSGTGEKINLLLIREYLRQGHAIPHPVVGRDVVGGYTELRRSGLIGPVVKCDVESLYPSLMLSERIAPASDTLGVFLPMLGELTERRLQAKTRKGRTSGTERTYWDGLQASFKILINSFFGYLGAGFFFNDPDAAERVTTGGQRIVRQVSALIEEAGGQVVEVDTDGVYFRPPEHIRTQEAEEEMIRSISAHLPSGINLAHDGRWRLMLSLKVKNYVLVGHDGRKVYRGAALRSRADERFGQDFIARAVDCIAEERIEEIGAIYADISLAIAEGRLTVHDFCRRSRVTSKALQGRSLKRASEALGGLAAGEYVRLYRRRDGTLARADDYAGDEDRDHLQTKLHKFAMRLEPVLGSRLRDLCPRPGAIRRAQAAGQQSLDLFGEG